MDLTRGQAIQWKINIHSLYNAKVVGMNIFVCSFCAWQTIKMLQKRRNKNSNAVQFQEKRNGCGKVVILLLYLIIKTYTNVSTSSKVIFFALVGWLVGYIVLPVFCYVMCSSTAHHCIFPIHTPYVLRSDTFILCKLNSSIFNCQLLPYVFPNRTCRSFFSLHFKMQRINAFCLCPFSAVFQLAFGFVYFLPFSTCALWQKMK